MTNGLVCYPGARVSRIANLPWRAALAQLGIIVAGVLIALAAQALWNNAQDRARERDYLAQLRVDWSRVRTSLTDWRPVIGTLRTLMATGDIRLIRDGELRTAIIEHFAFIDAISLSS